MSPRKPRTFVQSPNLVAHVVDGEGALGVISIENFGRIADSMLTIREARNLMEWLARALEWKRAQKAKGRKS